MGYPAHSLHFMALFSRSVFACGSSSNRHCYAACLRFLGDGRERDGVDALDGIPGVSGSLAFCGVAYREVAALGASCIAAGVPLHRAGSVLCSGIVLLPFLMGDSRIS